MQTITRFLNSHAPLLLTVGVVALIERLITVEWSTAYCMNPEDGPSFAATGFPLPYERYSGVSSLEFLFMPHVYLLNLFILTLIIFPLIRCVTNLRFISTMHNLRAILGAVGAILLILVLVWIMLYIKIGVMQPVYSIGDDWYGRFTNFRPVGIRWPSTETIECTKSPYWFPNGWHGQ